MHEGEAVSDLGAAAGRFLAEQLEEENAEVLREKLGEARELIRMLKEENARLRESLESGGGS